MLRASRHSKAPHSSDNNNNTPRLGPLLLKVFHTIFENAQALTFGKLSTCRLKINYQTGESYSSSGFLMWRAKTSL